MTKETWKLTFRDIAVNKVCNWIINTFATKEYAAFIQVTTSEGLKSLDQKVAQWVEEEKLNK